MTTLLNQLRFIAMSAGLAMALSSCSDSVSPRPRDPLMQRLVDMGFSPEMIVDQGEYFIVEGDILFSKEALRGDEPPPQDPAFPLPQFQWRTYNTVSGTNAQNIRVSISSGLSAGWAQATRQAMLEWSAISGTIIEFVETAPADIAVTSSSSLGGTIAVASFPASGKPGPTIQVSTSFEDYTASQKLFIMAHEFGHTIGFRHSDWSANLPNCGPESANPDGAILIGDTPATDAASVMNKCTGGTLWNGFSFWDVESVKFLYPVLPVLTLLGYPNGRPSLSWTSIPGNPTFRVEYSWWLCGLPDSEGFPTECERQRQNRTFTSDTFFVDNILFTGDERCVPTYQLFTIMAAGEKGSNLVDVANCDPGAP